MKESTFTPLVEQLEQLKAFKQLYAAQKELAKDPEQYKAWLIVRRSLDLKIDLSDGINGLYVVRKGNEYVVEMKAILMHNLITRKGHSIAVIKINDEECILKGTRNDTGLSVETSFTIENAANAGINIKFGVWKAFPQDMLYARALVRLGRRLFSDCIGTGALVEGELSGVHSLDEESSLPAPTVIPSSFPRPVPSTEEAQEKKEDPSIPSQPTPSLSPACTDGDHPIPSPSLEETPREETPTVDPRRSLTHKIVSRWNQCPSAKASIQALLKAKNWNWASAPLPFMERCLERLEEEIQEEKEAKNG